MNQNERRRRLRAETGAGEIERIVHEVSASRRSLRKQRTRRKKKRTRYITSHQPSSVLNDHTIAFTAVAPRRTHNQQFVSSFEATRFGRPRWRLDVLRFPRDAATAEATSATRRINAPRQGRPPHDGRLSTTRDSVGAAVMLSYSPAPAKSSKSSPLKSLRAMTVPPSGAKCPQSLLGSDRTVMSPADLRTVNANALPASFPTSVSPSPTQISPTISSSSPVTGFAVCATKARSASAFVP